MPSTRETAVISTVQDRVQRAAVADAVEKAFFNSLPDCPVCRDGKVFEGEAVCIACCLRILDASS